MTAALAEAREAGVSRVLTMGVDLDTSRRAVVLAEAHEEVLAAAGHHPLNDREPDLDGLAALAAHPRVVAVGEVGLDGSDPAGAPPDRQRAWFHAMCDLAASTGLPLSVHSRDAAAETLEILAAHPGVEGVMHYFSLGWDWARRFLDLGMHISFSGLVTRPSRTDLREVARLCPEDQLLLETDSPYGIPHHHRPPNRPALVLEVARVVAGARGVPVEEVALAATRNARRLFEKMT